MVPHPLQCQEGVEGTVETYSTRSATGNIELEVVHTLNLYKGLPNGDPGGELSNTPQKDMRGITYLVYN